jgi:formate dehydrogenase (coenzyme F420) beta subunit
MINELRKTCRKLLQDGTVKVVIGYGQAAAGDCVFPVFITNPDEVDRLVWNERCFANLTTYLTRDETRALGKVAICVKGCDQRALIVLEKESQIDLSELVVIGIACNGVGNPMLPKCKTCDVHTPRSANVVIGQSSSDAACSTGDGAPVKHMQTTSSPGRYAALDEFMKTSPEKRLSYWTSELSRCIKCYACRQACPLCYCRQCIVDKNRPVVISTSATPKGTMAWHITRAFHLAGRCVGCDECTRVCPAGIDLRLLNLSLAKAAEEAFGFRAGIDPQAEPVVGAFREQDSEEFIL